MVSMILSLLTVCCDEHIVEMKICDANTIINYDLPGSKTRFCNRLACMRKYFWDFSVAEEVCCMVYDFLVTIKGAPHECVIRTGQP